MSVRVLSRVFGNFHPDSEVSDRLVLITLADSAHDDGVTWIYQETIAEKTLLSSRQVERSIAALAGRGEIEIQKAQRGRKRVNVYRLSVATVEPDYDRLPFTLVASFATRQDGGPSEAHDPTGCRATTRQDGGPSEADTMHLDLDPSLDPSVSAREDEIDVPVIRRSDGKVIQLAPRPGKVDRKPVTDEEYLLADEVLSKFNELAGTRFRSADWISKIIMRLREHPGSTIEQHEQVIRGNLADPWWRGPASPSVIYGSGAQFERSIATVEQPANPDKPMSEEELAAWVRGDA